MNLFDFVGIQNLEESAGLETEVLIADYNDILTFPDLPDLTAGTNNTDYVDLGAEVFVMKAGKQFRKFEASLEKNAFQSTLVGSRGAMSFENTLTIQRNAMTPELTGFIRANRNRQLIVAFKPLGLSKYVVLGWKGLPAEVQAGNIDIPGEIAGDKMTNLEIRSIYYAPLFINAIPLTPGAA
jgi:hypothetical protein